MSDHNNIAESTMGESWSTEARQIRELNPRGVLFLCVANSARSQMAEGIARHLAPRTTNVFSAGSKPSGVHPMAIRALDEIGIDIRDQYSKSVDDIPAEAIDMVITLCEDEVCPIWLMKSETVHWPMPDPAAEDEDTLHAFRTVRDGLARRLKLVFEDQTNKEVLG